MKRGDMVNQLNNKVNERVIFTNVSFIFNVFFEAIKLVVIHQLNNIFEHTSCH